MEEFRLVNSLFNLYEISESGILRRVKDSKIIRLGMYGSGYLGTLLRDRGLKDHPNAFYVKNDKRPHVHVKLHILVAEAFLGKRPEGLVIDHIDRNKQNNHYTNLRYVTTSENWHNMSSESLAKIKRSSALNAKHMSELNKQNNHASTTKACCLVDTTGKEFYFKSKKDAYKFVTSNSGSLKTTGSVANKLMLGGIANGFRLKI